MISLISFNEALVIPEEEAVNLGLKYHPNPKIGWHDNKLQPMQSYHSYQEDCIEKDGKYYKNKVALEKNKSVESYYLYTKETGHIIYVLVSNEDHLVDLDSFAPKCKHKFFINESIKSEVPAINNINAILDTVEEKSSVLNSLVDKIRKTTFNSKTNVHVGGGLITTYNDLLLKEDACIDDLRNELNNGWRIIAVCNQPDQRRPDFILGRFNPQLKVAE